MPRTGVQPTAADPARLEPATARCLLPLLLLSAHTDRPCAQTRADGGRQRQDECRVETRRDVRRDETTRDETTREEVREAEGTRQEWRRERRRDESGDGRGRNEESATLPTHYCPLPLTPPRGRPTPRPSTHSPAPAMKSQQSMKFVPPIGRPKLRIAHSPTSHCRMVSTRKPTDLRPDHTMGSRMEAHYHSRRRAADPRHAPPHTHQHQR